MLGRNRKVEGGKFEDGTSSCLFVVQLRRPGVVGGYVFE